ncbi:MAG: uracil-DNA glycosylase [Alphaproteobacteria bacterium]|nr:uracil-DNA glycosylase [Alphaproteobacteria bacterium]
MQSTEPTNINTLNVDNLNRSELLDILSWYVDAGVDEAVDETSVNHFAELAPIPKLAEAPKPNSTPNIQTKTETPFADKPQAPPIPQASPTPRKPIGNANKTRMAKDLKAGQVDYQHSIKAAQKAAAACHNLEDLGKALNSFEECSLKHTAKHLIFGQGNQNADIMLVGESPGRDEDVIGHAFAGTNGEMLDQILHAIGLDRDKVWLSYLLPWRSLGGVAPSQANVDICQPFLMRQIELVDPKIIITFDGLVCKNLTKQQGSIIATRGKFSEIKVGDKAYKTLPTFHPQLLLNNPAYKQLVWQDFLSVMAEI